MHQYQLNMYNLNAWPTVISVNIDHPHTTYTHTIQTYMHHVKHTHKYACKLMQQRPLVDTVWER